MAELDAVIMPKADWTNALDATREKGGTTAPLKSGELAQAIRDIPTGGPATVIQPLTVTENGDYTAPLGVDGYSPVSVNVPLPSVEPEKVVEITSNGDIPITPSPGFDSMAKVTAKVNVPSGGGDDTEYDKFVERHPGEIVSKTATKLGVSACENYKGLTKFTGLNVKTLEDSCFRFCKRLSEVSFPVLEDVALGYRSFSDCTAFAKFDAPTTFKEFKGSLCFERCTSLVTVILRSSTLVALRNKNNYLDTPISKGTGYIYVPKALVDQYKTATNWVTYASQIRAIEDYPEITGG